MNHLYFAKSINGTVYRATKLHTYPEGDSTAAVIVKSFETLHHNGTSYLLTEKPALHFIMQSQSRDGLQYFFQKANIAYCYDKDFELVKMSPNWVETGSLTNKGKVVQLGEAIAVCETAFGRKAHLKKSLLPVSEELNDLKAESRAIEYGMELRKSLAAIGNKTPSAKPLFKVSFAGPKAQIVPSQDHMEGETRSFGPNDMRKLLRTPSGQMRWMNADEQAKMIADTKAKTDEANKTSERQKHAEGTKDPSIFAKLFRTGKEIFVGGKRATVIDHAHDIVAIQKEDGTTGTIRASEYNPDHNKPSDTLPSKKTTEKPEDTAQKELAKRAEQTALNTDVSGKTARKLYYGELTAIVNATKETEEFKHFENQCTAEGWTQDISTPFRFVKDAAHISPECQEESGTMERIYRPEKKEYDFYFNDEGFSVSYGGEQMRVTGIDGNKYTMRGQDGKEVKIKNTDLDDYKGVITLDEEGNASVKNMKGEDRGELTLDTGITQADLFREGTIKIIRNEIWKSITNGEGAVIEDIKLGKIRSGIVFYKHGDSIGVLDADMRQSEASQGDTRKAKSELTPEEKKVQAIVQKEREKLDKRALARQDVETVKARELHGNKNIPYADKGKGMEPKSYSDVMDKWIADGGNGMLDQIAESYTNPDEWKANVLSLSERLRVEDVNRAMRIVALNDTAKTGLIPPEPKMRDISAYLDTAKTMLAEKRAEIMKTKSSERKAAEREGDIPAKFEWDAPAELPSEDNGAIVSDTVKTIRDSRNDSYQVQYAFVPKQSVVSSHSIEGQSNADHPSELQARERENDYSSTLQMKQIAENPNEEIVEDNKDATRGAPVAYSKDGKVYIVQGNGRTGAVLGMKGEGQKKYFGMMLQKAQELGIPTDKVNEDMMLVRVLSPVHTYEDARKLGAFGQKSSALPLTEVEEARGYQNAQRMPFDSNVNLGGIGRRAITEKNVGTFIRNNPELYKKMLSASSFDATAIADRPAEQAKIVNTALLSQLNKDFIRTVSRKGESTQELVKGIAPIISQNQKDLADGVIPPEGDIQRMLKNTIEQYDTLPSNMKNGLKADKNGNVPFLEIGEEGRKNPDSLISRMRQEAIEFGDGKSGNTFRNPINVISLIAYHNAMTPKDPDKRDAAREVYALKVKRFADALKTIKDQKAQGPDIFGAMESDAEQKQQEQDDIIKIAERVFLENKSYAPEAVEELTAEEKEAAQETSNAFNVHKKMKEAGKEFGFALEGHKLRKSIMAFIFGTELEDQREELRLWKSQLDMFSPTPLQAKAPTKNSGNPWKKLGQEKPNHKYIRRQRGTNGEWEYIYKDEQGKEYKGSEKSDKPLPKNADWKEGDTVKYSGKSYKLSGIGNILAVLEDAQGNKTSARITEITHEAEEQKQLVESAESKWDRLVNILETDLKRGSKSGVYEYAADKPELERKLKAAREDRDAKKKMRQEKDKPTVDKAATVESDGDNKTPTEKPIPQTKIPELQSVNKFIESNPDVKEMLNSSTASKGQCDSVAKSLAKYLNDNGIKATVIGATGFKGNMGEDAHIDWKQFIGDDPNTNKKYLWHAVVMTDDSIIDITGSQYGKEYSGIRVIPHAEFAKEWESFKTHPQYPEAGVKVKMGKSIAGITEAREETNTEPTEAQKEAGNYSKGRIKVHGLDIAIENPKGSIRRGKTKDGAEWECKVKADYGYFTAKDADGKQIQSKDGDSVDVFIGDKSKSSKIWIINQINPDTKEFDEVKILIAFKNKTKAVKAYKSSYSDDAQKRIGNIIEMSTDEFKEWLKHGNKHEYAANTTTK